MNDIKPLDYDELRAALVMLGTDWEPDIDDPGTSSEKWTGKWYRSGPTSTFDPSTASPEMARAVASLINAMPRLLRLETTLTVFKHDARAYLAAVDEWTEISNLKWNNVTLQRKRFDLAKHELNSARSRLCETLSYQDSETEDEAIPEVPIIETLPVEPEEN
jgi:hypothetical protein